MAANTMDAIKKKMQAMKIEKENALEKSDEMEQKLQEQKAVNEKVSLSKFFQKKSKSFKIPEKRYRENINHNAQLRHSRSPVPPRNHYPPRGHPIHYPPDSWGL